jgi:hypothetical protein
VYARVYVDVRPCPRPLLVDFILRGFFIDKGDMLTALAALLEHNCSYRPTQEEYEAIPGRRCGARAGVEIAGMAEMVRDCGRVPLRCHHLFNCTRTLYRHSVHYTLVDHCLGCCRCGFVSVVVVVFWRWRQKEAASTSSTKAQASMRAKFTACSSSF